MRSIFCRLFNPKSSVSEQAFATDSIPENVLKKIRDLIDYSQKLENRIIARNKIIADISAITQEIQEEIQTLLKTTPETEGVRLIKESLKKVDEILEKINEELPSYLRPINSKVDDLHRINFTPQKELSEQADLEASLTNSILKRDPKKSKK